VTAPAAPGPAGTELAAAPGAAADVASDPVEAQGWSATVYMWLAAGTVIALAALHARGRRPLALGGDRVRWPLAPAPSLFLVAVLMMAGAAAASGAMQLSGAATPGGVRDSAIASLANYGTQLLLMSGIWWALSGALMQRAEAPVDGVAARPGSAASGRARAAAVGALAMAVAWPLTQATGVIASTVQRSVTGTDAPDTAHRTLEAMGQSGDPLWIAAMGVVAVLLAPLVEEIVYRGALQQALKGIGVPRVIALLAASALFSLAHWGSLVAGAEAGALAMLMVLGVVFGWTYERTGSLWAPFAAHATFNAANLAIFLAQR